MLRIRQLGFSFREEPVLRDLNITCERGEFASLLGASGCGKSTLLRLIAGLKRPDSGSIERGEQDATMGFVFQRPTLCPWLSASENVELPLRLRNVSKPVRHSQARDALELVGLRSGDTKKLPAQLSGGMQMRVSLARAFVTKPGLLLMDEPFSALDEVLRQQLCETTLRLWQREMWTTVFVTHNVAEAVFLSQRIHILAGKPATIVETVSVPFKERTSELRLSTDYLALVSEVAQKLRAAVEASLPDHVGGDQHSAFPDEGATA